MYLHELNLQYILALIWMFDDCELAYMFRPEPIVIRARQVIERPYEPEMAKECWPSM